jgi:hypothetical protein
MNDEELNEYLRKYSKRTGIFRLYQLDLENKKTRLLLEFVVRGKVLGNLHLWRKRHHLFKD